jgi:hypothetical protein
VLDGIWPWGLVSRPESAADGKVGLLTAPAEALVSYGPGGLTFLGGSFHQNDTGACPPLGTHS